jgi:hypothetical protein
MEIIWYLIGMSIVFIPYGILKIRQAKYNTSREWYHAKWLSKDKEPEFYRGGYIIYANGTRWFLNTFVTWELYWIPLSLGDDLDKLICDSNLQFKSTWLPSNTMFKMLKRIINTHPNLEANGFYKIVKLFN